MLEFYTYCTRDQLLLIDLSNIPFARRSKCAGTPHVAPSRNVADLVFLAGAPNASITPTPHSPTCCMSFPTNRIQRQPSHRRGQHYGPFDLRTNDYRSKRHDVPHCPTMLWRHGPIQPPLRYSPSTKAWPAAAGPSTMGSWSLPPRSIPRRETSPQSADCALGIVSMPPSTRNRSQSLQALGKMALVPAE